MTKMGIRRAEVEKFAEEHGIELEITEFRKNYSNHGRAGYPPGVAGTGINHVHAYTKTGEIFGGIDLHNMSVWDCDCAVALASASQGVAAINWADVLADLCDHMPVPCPLCLANGGDTVYEAYPKGDGLFEDDEREDHLIKACEAIRKANLNRYLKKRYEDH